MKCLRIIVAAAALVSAISAGSIAAATVSEKDLVIVTPRGASAMETLAAREVRRYVSLRTGLLVPVVEVQDTLPGKAAVVVARKDRAIVSAVADAREIFQVR